MEVEHRQVSGLLQISFTSVKYTVRHSAEMKMGIYCIFDDLLEFPYNSLWHDIVSQANRVRGGVYCCDKFDSKKDPALVHITHRDLHYLFTV